MPVKKKNVGKLLNIYLHENQVLIKKITAYRTMYFMYRIMVNASSDDPYIFWKVLYKKMSLL